MNDSEFERLLQRKYAQVVLKALLDAEGNRYAFSALLAEVNAIIAAKTTHSDTASNDYYLSLHTDSEL